MIIELKAIINVPYTTIIFLKSELKSNTFYTLTFCPLD